MSGRSRGVVADPCLQNKNQKKPLGHPKSCDVRLSRNVDMSSRLSFICSNSDLQADMVDVGGPGGGPPLPLGGGPGGLPVGFPEGGEPGGGPGGGEPDGREPGG